MSFNYELGTLKYKPGDLLVFQQNPNQEKRYYLISESKNGNYHFILDYGYFDADMWYRIDGNKNYRESTLEEISQYLTQIHVSKFKKGDVVFDQHNGRLYKVLNKHISETQPGSNKFLVYYHLFEEFNKIFTKQDCYSFDRTYSSQTNGDKMKSYFVVYKNFEDNVIINKMTKKELENSLNSMRWKDYTFSNEIGRHGSVEKGKLYIIEGKSIVPKPVSKIVSYEVE